MTVFCQCETKCGSRLRTTKDFIAQESIEAVVNKLIYSPFGCENSDSMPLTPEGVDLAMGLLQLIALSLPAVAILMQVLLKTHEARFDKSSGEFIEDGSTHVSLSPITTANQIIMKSKAPNKRVFMFSQWSFLSFVLSGTLVLTAVFFHRQILVVPTVLREAGFRSALLLDLGTVFLIIAFSLLGISVTVARPQIWRVTLRKTKRLISRLRKQLKFLTG